MPDEQSKLNRLTAAGATPAELADVKVEDFPKKSRWRETLGLTDDHITPHMEYASKKARMRREAQAAEERKLNSQSEPLKPVS